MAYKCHSKCSFQAVALNADSGCMQEDARSQHNQPHAALVVDKSTSCPTTGNFHELPVFCFLPWDTHRAHQITGGVRSPDRPRVADVGHVEPTLALRPTSRQA